MVFSIQEAIHRLCPFSAYSGNFINNTKEEYDAIFWMPHNTCPKPTWEELVEVMRPTKEEVYAEKLQSISTQFQGLLNAFNDQYTDEERETWPVQIEEANLFTNDPTAHTPFLDNLVITRGKGETKEELVQKIMQNNDRYRGYWGNLAGQEQSLRGSLYAVWIDPEKTAEDLEAVSVTFSVPPLD